MKKTITIEQLEELSEKGKERLREWIESKLSPPISGSAYIGPLSSLYQTSYFMTIGQMIEFLEDKSKKHKGKYFTRDDKVLSIMFAVSDLRPVKVLNWQGDLCDTLWVTVKDFLEYDDK